jgi:hypothetical protein
MGINAALYLEIGGFGDLPTHEDRDLYFRAASIGVVARHDATVPVTTSARRLARAPMGFAHALTVIEQEAEGTRIDGVCQAPKEPTCDVSVPPLSKTGATSGG